MTTTNNRIVPSRLRSAMEKHKIRGVKALYGLALSKGQDICDESCRRALMGLAAYPTAVKLAAALGVTPSYLMGEKQ